MIRTESEYRATLACFEQGKEVAARQRAELAKQNLTPEEIERAMAPLLAFQMQFVEEATWYERVRSGDLAPIHDLNQIGHVLVGLRIASGITQKNWPSGWAFRRRLSLVMSVMSITASPWSERSAF